MHRTSSVETLEIKLKCCDRMSEMLTERAKQKARVQMALPPKSAEGATLALYVPFDVLEMIVGQLDYRSYCRLRGVSKVLRVALSQGATFSSMLCRQRIPLRAANKLFTLDREAEEALKKTKRTGIDKTVSGQEVARVIKACYGGCWEEFVDARFVERSAVSIAKKRALYASLLLLKTLLV